MSRVAKTPRAAAPHRIAGESNDHGIDAVPKKQARFEITVALGRDNEPKEIFIGGATTGDVRIRRGKKVIVSQEIIDRLNDAVCQEREADDENDPSSFAMVERQRFPYQVHQAV